MRIELVVSDSCSNPEILRLDGCIQVRIGLGHDFDDILDLCSPELDSESMALVHRLWSDDDFPRHFARVGDSLVITARQD